MVMIVCCIISCDAGTPNQSAIACIKPVTRKQYCYVHRLGTLRLLCLCWHAGMLFLPSRCSVACSATSGTFRPDLLSPITLPTYILSADAVQHWIICSMLPGYSLLFICSCAVECR